MMANTRATLALPGIKQYEGLWKSIWRLKSQIARRLQSGYCMMKARFYAQNLGTNA
jgi:hypothetical protein